MPKEHKLDDFDAIRVLVETLSPFEINDRERIIRWACEKMGMAAIQSVNTMGAKATASVNNPSVSINEKRESPQSRDIKSFYAEKSPKSDIQLAAVVAYYYKFEAPSSEHKEAINGDDLVDACRKIDCTRPARARQTMLNAFNAGYFDKAGVGQYRLNAVGENLVAMVLPAGNGETKVKLMKHRTRKNKVNKH